MPNSEPEKNEIEYHSELIQHENKKRIYLIIIVVIIAIIIGLFWIYSFRNRLMGLDLKGAPETELIRKAQMNFEETNNLIKANEKSDAYNATRVKDTLKDILNAAARAEQATTTFSSTSTIN